ncbi:FAD-dependent thymidylate synthase [Desulfolucanica intricata]|uniref:FAD-dependent thymidylate synthase n=1 Tax=Desulfolucanica intricata TaxID=1285191 RepID=UPI00082A53B0|nr:FAD-dependent thymidylate synthase [Desulfolucanica intricata]
MIIEQPKVFVPKAELHTDKLKNLEKFGRVCYKSEDLISEDSADKFLRKILSIGHESVIEHEKATVIFVVDRGISHEIVRHRIASYSQESTRYCNYSRSKFSNEITVIEPFFYKNRKELYGCWKNSCEEAEKAYMKLVSCESTAQEARSVLPNSLKTEIVVTYNFREWRHFFKLRCSREAHPQMRQVTIPLLLLFKDKMPVLFEDIKYDERFPQEYYAEIILT